MKTELVSANLKAKKVELAGGRTDGVYVEEYEAVGGLTLRDYFAAQALPSVWKIYCHEGFAIEAYRIADAMIEARKITRSAKE